MRKHICWLAAAGVTLLLRTWLLLAAVVPFNGDEAVVALMARHINRGARPLFFYGQSYMGSLDAYLVAGGFAVFGEQIWVIRLVQMLLYCGFIYTGWLLARRVLQDPQAAGFTTLLLAVPPVVVTTYTAATLGGYGESLLFGNLILILGYDVLMTDRAERAWTWLALGLVGGLAFWTLGIAGVYLLPVGLLGLLRFRREWLPKIGLAAAAFIIGSLPWWVENFTRDWAALDVLLGRGALTLAPTTPWDRLIGFFLLGLPALFGFREPWEAGFGPMWMLAAGVLLMCGLVLFVVEARRKGWAIWNPGGGRLLSMFAGVFVLVFIGSHFGVDATGRYLLPLYLPVAIVLGAAAARVRRRSSAGFVLVGLVLLFNLSGNLLAAAAPDGLTTQFDPITRFGNEYDAELIEFLESYGLERGYTNYWVAYRLAFLTGETLIYTPRLPYKADLSYTVNDNRYRPYDERVEAEGGQAFITTLHPGLDGLIEKGLNGRGIAFDAVSIGPFRVFYDFSQAVRPEDILPALYP